MIDTRRSRFPAGEGGGGDFRLEVTGVMFRRFPEHRVPKRPSPKISQKSETLVYFSRSINTTRHQFQKLQSSQCASALLNKAIRSEIYQSN